MKEIITIRDGLLLKKAVLNMLTVLEAGPTNSSELSSRVKIHTRLAGRIMSKLTNDNPEVLSRDVTVNSPTLFTLTPGASYDALRAELAAELVSHAELLEVELTAILRLAQSITKE